VSLTLLLDLDDTLLVNSTEKFLPVYLQALTRELSQYAPPEQLIGRLLDSVRRMMENRRPDCTLKEVFDESFYPTLGLDPEALAEPIERFYDEVFPTLQYITSPRPASVTLVQEALRRGYRLVIATNPLFPRKAMLHRLSWAGFSPQEYRFPLVTSYEVFHFCKPNPAYYAEILATLGWPEEPVVMLGDDLDNDIRAARMLGIPAFWLKKDGVQPPDGPFGPSASGEIEDFLPWLDSLSAEALEPDYSLPSAMLAVLLSTPAALDTYVKNVPLERWNIRPSADEWSITEILCHLRDVDGEVNYPRVKKVLEETNPFIPGKDTDPWADERGYIHEPGPAALQAFTRVRLQLLETLENLTDEEWQRTARHAILGPTRLSELVGIIAAHDRLHIRQIRELIQ